MNRLFGGKPQQQAPPPPPPPPSAPKVEMPKADFNLMQKKVPFHSNLGVKQIPRALRDHHRVREIGSRDVPESKGCKGLLKGDV